MLPNAAWSLALHPTVVPDASSAAVSVAHQMSTALVLSQGSVWAATDSDQVAGCALRRLNCFEFLGDGYTGSVAGK